MVNCWVCVGVGYNDGGIILPLPLAWQPAVFALLWGYFGKSSAGLRAKKLYGRNSNS